MGSIVMYIGGARSGKSRLAQQRLENGKTLAAYIATAAPADHEGRVDPEMQARIARHQKDRPQNWLTIEEPRDLARALQRAAQGGARRVLVDCLTLWLTNRVMDLWPERWNDVAEIGLLGELERVLTVAKPDFETLVLVTNELGTGLVPTTPLGRIFRDVQGRANQTAARIADDVQFVVAGLTLKMK